ncbi:hypothetical protein AGMMS49983_03180 [Clostridia bacterium]|nr:hypothetical protein AGMMS49983_03180 [Clostridia bacterium]
MKDFFYNKSDVLIAILIILVAAFVIYTRVGIIMDYPSKMAGGEGNTYMPDIQDVLTDGLGGDRTHTTGGGLPDDVVTNDVTPAVTAESPETAETTDDAWTAVTPADEDEPAEVVTPAETVTPPAPGTPQVDTSITVSPGDVGSVIGDKLVAAGAITDKSAFLAEVTAQGADSKLKSGMFKIPAGATLAEIVKILVG